MSETQQQATISEETVFQCLGCVFTAVQQADRQQANNYLIGCEESHLFPPILLSIYEKSEDQRIKLSAFMYLKNVIQRYWSVRNNQKGKVGTFPEESKTYLRNYFITMLGSVQENSMRKHLNACIGSIIASEPPNFFPQIQDFIQKSLWSLQELLNQGQVGVLSKTETTNLLKTCKIVLKQLSKKRFHNQQSNQLIQNNLSIILQIWDLVNKFVQKTLTDKDLQSFELLTSVSTSFDKILLFCISSQQSDIQVEYHETYSILTNDSSTVQNIIAKVLGKLVGIIELVNMVGQNSEVKDLLVKQIRSITQNLISIQMQYPLSLAGEINNYLQIAWKLISECEKFEDENVLKCGILAFFRVAKQFTYYATPEQYSVTITKTKLPSYQSLQEVCYKEFYTFFTQQQIEELLNLLITKILPLHFKQTQSGYTKNDDIIEKDDESYMDDAVNELENSIYNISMCAIEQILLRFSPVCLTLLSSLTSQLLSNNFANISYEEQEGVFAIIGFVPKVCSKIAANPHSIIKISELLQYLFLNHGTLPFAARRIPILVSRWITTLPESVQNEVVERIVELIFQHPESPAVRYECCMCLSDIVKLDAQINYSQLISKVAPVIVELFACFEVANVLWKLISFLSSILQKCQSSQNHEQLLLVLSNSQLNNLLETESELLRGALSDMFMDLIAFFPPLTPLQPIFSLALKFINDQLQKKKLDLYILKLWYFIVKEYSAEQNLDEEMKSILFRYIGLLSSVQEDDEIIIKSLAIIEEYILLEFIPLNSQEILQYIEKTYNTAAIFEQNGLQEQCIDIKTQALNLLGTAILIMLNRNDQNILSSLEVLKYLVVHSIMKLLIVDLACSNFNKTIKSVPTFRAILQTIFNRFLISDFKAMIAFIQQCNAQPEGFLQSWIINMEYADSKNTSKINTIAVLTILPLISQSTFTTYFGYILKRMLPDLHNHIDLLNGQTPPEILQNMFAVRSRKDEKIYSARKKQLRKTQLYENFNLLQFFQTQIKDDKIQQIKASFSAFNVSEQDLQMIVQDEGRMQQFMNIMNSQ